MSPFPCRILPVAGMGIATFATFSCSVSPPDADRSVTAIQVLPFAVEGPIDQPDFVGTAIAESLARARRQIATTVFPWQG